MKTVQENETQAMVLPSLHRVPPVAKACRIGLVPVTCNCPLHHTSHVPCLACFGGGVVREDGRSSRKHCWPCLPKLFSFWGRNNFNQAVECNLQIGWNLSFHRGSKTGWYNQNIAERLITFYRSCKLLEYTWIYLNGFDASWYINTSDFFIPSLPSAFESNAQVIAYITARTGTERLFRDVTECIWGLRKLLENERPVRLDEFCIQCFGEVYWVARSSRDRHQFYICLLFPVLPSSKAKGLIMSDKYIR